MDLKVKLRASSTDFKVQPQNYIGKVLLSDWAKDVYNRIYAEADSRVRNCSIEDVELVFGVVDTLNSYSEEELRDYWPQKFLTKGVPHMLASFGRPLWVRFDNDRLKGYDYQVSYDLEGRLPLDGANFQKYEDALCRIAMLRRSGVEIPLQQFERRGWVFSDDLREHTCVNGNIHWDADTPLFWPIYLWIPVREEKFYNCPLTDEAWRLAMLRYLVDGFKKVKTAREA